MSNDFQDDDLSALFGGTGQPRPRPTPPADFVPVLERMHTESCPKCSGSGRFITYSGRDLGECFTCKGQGARTFKTSRGDRVKAKAQREDRQDRQRVDNAAAFEAEHPAEWDWLKRTAGRWDVALSFMQGITKYGSLTDKQMAVVRNGMMRDAARAERRAASAPAVDVAGVDRLKAAFDQAIAFSAEKGLKKSPRITIGGMTIKPAKAASKNPGALYVTSGEEYLGKIVGAKFYATAAVTTDHEAQLALFLTDPAAAAKVYGQETGTCCVCNATLRSEWRLRGIGPVCAEKFGW